MQVANDGAEPFTIRVDFKPRVAHDGDQPTPARVGMGPNPRSPSIDSTWCSRVRGVTLLPVLRVSSGGRRATAGEPSTQNCERKFQVSPGIQLLGPVSGDEGVCGPTKMQDRVGNPSSQP